MSASAQRMHGSDHARLPVCSGSICKKIVEICNSELKSEMCERIEGYFNDLSTTVQSIYDLRGI